MNVIEKFGNKVSSQALKDPEKARRLLLAGYRLQEKKLQFLPDRELPSSGQYVARVVMKNIIQSLSEPENAAMVSIFVPGELVMAAGLDGIENRIDPSANGWGPYDYNLYELSSEQQARIQSLPKTLEEALDALERDHDYLTKNGVFPERLIQIWLERKRKESRMISQIPHPAEFGAYYDL